MIYLNQFKISIVHLIDSDINFFSFLSPNLQKKQKLKVFLEFAFQKQRKAKQLGVLKKFKNFFYKSLNVLQLIINTAQKKLQSDNQKPLYLSLFHTLESKIKKQKMKSQKQNTQHSRDTEYSQNQNLTEEGSLSYSLPSQTLLLQNCSFATNLQQMESINNLLSETSENFYQFSLNPSLQEEESWSEADTTLSRIKSLLNQFPQSNPFSTEQGPKESRQDQNSDSYLEQEAEQEQEKIYDEWKNRKKYRQESDEEVMDEKILQKSEYREDSDLTDGGKSLFQYKFKMLKPDEQVSRYYQRQVFQQKAPDYCRASPLQLREKVINIYIEPTIQQTEKEIHKSYLTDRKHVSRSSHSEFKVQPLNLKIGQSPVHLPNQLSSEGNRTDRSLYKAYPNFNDLDTLKIREFSDPNIDITQFYEIKERLYHMEEHKNNIMEQLRVADNQIMRLREEKWFMKEMIDALQNQDNQKIIQLKQSLGQYVQQMNSLESQTQNKDKEIQELFQNNHQLSTHLENLSHYASDLEMKNDKLKLQYEQQKYSSIREIQKLNEEMGSKQNYILDLQKKLEENQFERRVEIVQFEQINQDLKSQIDELTKSVDAKQSEIQKLVASKEDLLKTIQLSSLSNQSDSIDELTAQRIFSAQFEKMKQEIDFLQLTRKNNEKYFIIENGKLKREVDQHKIREQKYQSMLSESGKKIKILNQELKQQQNYLNKEKKKIESYFELQINHLRKQILSFNLQLKEKQQKLKEQSIQLRRLRKSSPGNIKIQFIHEQQSYLNELKEIMKEYQIVLEENEITIKQLRKKSHKFLCDAFKNEKQLQKLSELNYKQNSQIKIINQEKTEIEYENRRMRNMIKESEKRIKAISRKMKMKKGIQTSNEASTDHTISQVIA